MRRRHHTRGAARAAERDEREVARIDALLDGDDANRAFHRRVHHRDDTLGRDTSACERATSGVGIEVTEPGERAVGGNAPQQEVGVGHRRVLAAAPVAGRPGSGTCALRPTTSAPPLSSRAIEPPPAPIVCTATAGSRIG